MTGKPVQYLLKLYFFSNFISVPEIKSLKNNTNSTNIAGVEYNGEWGEVDTPTDLLLYNENKSAFELFYLSIPNFCCVRYFVATIC